MKISKTEEVIFGKGFVPVLAVFFTGTEEEIVQFTTLQRSGDWIYIVIDPAGPVTFKGERIGPSE